MVLVDRLWGRLPVWARLFGLLGLCGVAVGAEEPPAQRTLTVLLVTGQSNHRWTLTSPVLKRILEETGRFEVTVSTTPPARSSPEAWQAWRPMFADYSVVVSDYNGEPWPEPVRHAFETYVRSGGGFVVVHAANNAFASWPEYNRMIGVGGWGGRDAGSGLRLEWRDGRVVRVADAGPAGHHGARHAFDVETREPGHPVMAGLPSRWRHTEDELYDSLRGPAEEVTVLATAWSDPAKGGTGRHEPVLMTIGYGKGRVFHTVLGHDLKGMESAGFRATLARGAEWAATGAVTLAVPEELAGSGVAPGGAGDWARGEKIYRRAGSCVVCHGIDGQGVPGSFPPLVGSDVVSGDWDRLVWVVLHGLRGPVTVGGRVYDGLMPAQGTLLTDAEMADVLTYVRGSWGNDAPDVSAEQVASVRARFPGRLEPWTAGELSAEPDRSGGGEGLVGLTRRVYASRWDRLPDFGALAPVKEEPAARDRVSLDSIGPERDFGVRFLGTFRVATPGIHRFEVVADDGAVVRVAGREVLRIDEIGPARRAEGALELPAGSHPFELDYFCARGIPQLALSWVGPAARGRAIPLSAGRPVQAVDPARVLRAEGELPAIYRNPIHVAGARTIGVGFPSGLNLAFDAERCQPVLAWTGLFLDPTPQWSGRGEGVLLPLGEDLVTLVRTPPFEKAVPADRPWPGTRAGPHGKPEGYRFRGYLLERNGTVVFRYDFRELEVEDALGPIDGGETPVALRRSIRVRGDAGPGGLTYLAAVGRSVAPRGSGFEVDGVLRVHFPDWKGKPPAIHRVGANAELRLELPPGDVEWVQEYRWSREVQP